MAGSWDAADFPRLTPDSFVTTSPATHRYNCIAWAAGETRRKWWPDPANIGYWPKGAPRKETLDAFVLAYKTLGYSVCEDGSLEPGFQKIALFTKRYLSGTRPTHAALQLPSGRWTSKLGDLEDIDHVNLDALRGPAYGAVACYLKRLRP